MHNDSEKKKKGYTTILLELSVAARGKVPAPENDRLNAPARFLPDRAKPEYIQQSLQRCFATAAG